METFCRKAPTYEPSWCLHICRDEPTQEMADSDSTNQFAKDGLVWGTLVHSRHCCGKHRPGHPKFTKPGDLLA